MENGEPELVGIQHFGLDSGKFTYHGIGCDYAVYFKDKQCRGIGDCNSGGSLIDKKVQKRRYYGIYFLIYGIYSGKCVVKADYMQDKTFLYK